MTPITTTEALRDFCAKLSNQPFITVDTEFMRETTYWPRLCLIQAASATDAAIIAPMADGLALSPILGLMRDESIVNVVH
ncbi:MAG: ribonuclease D, partial [Brevundimonas sp.]|nr:ribonuclease D [Brevundimonas sp.]